MDYHLYDNELDLIKKHLAFSAPGDFSYPREPVLAGAGCAQTVA